MARERTIYRETYKRGTSIAPDDALPVLRHLREGGRHDGASVQHTVVRTDLLASGTVEVGGEQLEYQDLRVYVKFP